MNSAVLTHPDFSRPFILSTNVSLDGLGKVLSQVTEGETIAFASKVLMHAQAKYPAHHLEFFQSVEGPPCETPSCCPLSSAEVSAVLEGHSN